MDPEEITPELLLSAYASGVFPMADHQDATEIYWVDPRQRGIVPLDSFHISRSLSRRLRSGRYTVTYDQDFRAVLTGCAERPVTWINERIFELYAELADLGKAHSVEVWNGDRLVGGVYGVTLGAAFFGESMFSRDTDASKVALAWLVAGLRRGGFTLFDTQFISPHLASLGAIEIPRASYHQRLYAALNLKAHFDKGMHGLTLQEVLQLRTHTS